MAQYPYILTTNALGEFLDGIPSRGVPDRVTGKYIASLGFKSSAHRNILSVLKFIGFLDDKGVPTENYRAFRDKSGQPRVMAKALRQAYGDLFTTYPDAYRKDEESLRNFFVGTTELGERAVDGMVGTFKVL